MAAASEDSENVNVKTAMDETIVEVNESNRLFKLADLKVAELKSELEKRSLDKNGVKSVLMERLKSALLEEGKDPEEFSFDILADNSKTKIIFKKKKISDSETNGEMDGSDENNDLSFETENVPNSEIHNLVNKELDKPSHSKLDKSVDLEINDSVESEANSKIDLEIDKIVALETDLEINKSVDLEMPKSSEVNELVNTKESKLSDLESNKSANSHSEENKLAHSNIKNTPNLKENDSAELEINNSDYLEINNVEDKMNCEITLQLSIDEEEAQLNEDENIMDIPKSVDEVDSKSTEESKLSSNTSCNKSAPVEISNHTTPVKTSKSVAEDDKEKKISKTPVHSKALESTISPKVLKVIGKNDKMKNANVLAKSLWVTALPTATRAADLKTLFSKQGRVLSVKIVKSTKQTPGKCYGFVTMATSTDATKAIQNLHHTELNGQTISVERTQSEPSALLKKSESKVLTGSGKKQLVKKEISKGGEGAKAPSSENKSASKTDTKPVEKKSEDATKTKEEKRKSSERVKSKEKDTKSREFKERDSKRPVRRPPFSNRSRPFAFNERPRYGAFGRSFFSNRSGIGFSSYRPQSGMPLYERIREERIRQRERFRDRERRDIERRHAVEISRHKYIERKQREEAYRLEREKERLRLEREFLERERAEMLKLEREKQLFERVRLAREREELRRQAELRRSTKRPRVVRESVAFWDGRKKMRFEERPTFPVEKLRLEASTSSHYEFPVRERSRSITRHEFVRHPERFSSSKGFDPPSRSGFSDRIRREVSMRTREDRRIFERSDTRDRDHRRSLPSRERPSSRREAPPRSMDWKHERRVQERVVPPRSSGQRRMTYY